MLIARFIKFSLRLLIVTSLLLAIIYFVYYGDIGSLKHKQYFGGKREASIYSFIKPTITTSCPILSIDIFNTSTGHYDENVKCKPIPTLEKDCYTANKRYGKPRLFAGYCPKQHLQQVIHELCFFKIIKNENKPQLICDVNICSASVVRIGKFQPTNGMFMPLDRWYMAYNNTAVEQIIMNLYQQTEETFCILACFFQNKYIKQALVFPPRIKLKEKTLKKEKHINVNIVVLDSVSRQHFYRQLLESISQFKTLQNNNNKTLVLDFELFQSLAPRTFPNMRAMFSGKVDIDSDDEINSYGIDVLVGYYKELGYQTLLQEDSCWYDSWGALITDNKHKENMSSDWLNIQKKMKSLPINDYGLTHLSCEVFKQYGRTNQFNYPSKVCYNGLLLPEYFLNYSYQYVTAIEQNQEAEPGFTYTHLNTAHETTGQRVAQMDSILSIYIRNIANLQNTLTIIMSDHGPKTTKYSQENLAGRYEIGHSFMFMIIPKNVQNILGTSQISALRTNQRRLISTLDLYKTLKTLNIEASDGLLEELPMERYCNDVPMYSFINCLCDGAVKLVTPFSAVHWLAEFTLGYLNQQLTDTLLANHHENGYANCERLIGCRFNKVRRTKDSIGSYIYVMDIIADKYRGGEIFEVVVKVDATSVHNYKNFNKVKVLKWRRVTIFQHFTKCCDKNVNVEICICRKESSGVKNPGRDISRLLSTPIFNIRTNSIFLDSKCLLLLTRLLPESFLTYELSNICTDRIYETNFEIFTQQQELIMSTVSLPIKITVHPWFIYYVTTIVWNKESKDFKENVTFTITYI